MNYFPHFSSRCEIAGACVVALLGSMVPAGAILTVSYQTDPNQGYFAVNNADLINSGSPDLSSTTDTGYTPFTYEGGTSTTMALNDGLLGLNYASNNGALSTAAFDLDGTWSSTFLLNGGYTINQIATVASWPAARASQAYTVSVRQVGNTIFTPLTTIDYMVSSDQSSKIVISDNSGPLATNVDAIRFDFVTATGGAASIESVYREIDVFGTIPEPSSLGLLALGGAALLLRRVRKR